MIYKAIFILTLIVLITLFDYLIVGARKGMSFNEWHQDMLNKDREFMISLLFLSTVIVTFGTMALLLIILAPLVFSFFSLICQFIEWGGNLVKHTLNYWI